jgi:threonyl-tRNA synthetase
MFIDEFYKTFGFEYSLELSTRPPKRMGTDEQWDKAEKALKAALDKLGKKYKVNEGDGAFYGPKIDFHIKDSLGRSWQCATEQLDFQMPLRFNVTYEDKDSKQKHPVMLHSVAAGSVERFFAILVEHFEGKFPTWLAPTQVVVLTISDNQMKYGEEVDRKKDRNDWCKNQRLAIAKSSLHGHHRSKRR